MSDEGYVLGIDPSLTSTGFCKLWKGDKETDWKDDVYTGTETTGPCGPTWDERHHRYMETCRCVVDQCATTGGTPSLVVIEHYSFSSNNRSHHDLVELGCLLRLWAGDMIGDHGSIVEVAPTTLKKFVIGKGGGAGTGKNKMALATFKRWGVEFQTDDECDAYGLARIGLCLMRWAVAENKAQEEVVELLQKQVHLNE